MPNRIAQLKADVENKYPGSFLKKRVENGVIFQRLDGKEEHRYTTGPWHWRQKETDKWIEIDTDIENYEDLIWKHHIKSAKFDTLLTDDGKKRFYPRRWITDEYVEFGALEWKAGNKWSAVPMGIATILNNKLAGEKISTHNLEIGFNGVGSRTNLIIKNQSVDRNLRYKVDLVGLALNNGVLTSESDNKNVGFMRQPYWTDSSENSEKHKISFEYKDGYITLTPDLKNAVYPVNIDPDYSIVAGADDGYSLPGASAFNSTDSYSHLGAAGGWVPGYNIWLRFQSIVAGQGDNCTAATIEFTNAAGGNGTDLQFLISGVDEDDHTAPTTYAEWATDNGILTTANVHWDGNFNTTQGQTFTTDDFSGVIDELFARGGWATGQDVGIQINDDGCANYAYRRPAMYEDTTYTEPILSLTIEAGATPTKIEKSLKYCIEDTPSAKTKSLKYTVEATPAAITKSLKYCVLITPTALTRSLQYAIDLGSTAIQKSLAYEIKAEIVIQKSLKYTVEATASAIQKSLKYCVPNTPSALTRSLKYTIEITPSAITKSLTYNVIGAEVTIQKSLKYCVEATPSAPTKSLKYCVSVEISPITKSLVYNITQTPSAITKGLIYEILSDVAITKSLKYTIQATASAITKSLQYHIIETVLVVIQKSLKYDILSGTYSKRTGDYSQTNNYSKRDDYSLLP